MYRLTALTDILNNSSQIFYSAELPCSIFLCSELIFLHFSHCSRHRNMSFRSLFCMHGYEHNKCFPFSNRKVFGSVHWRTLSWTLSWTLMPHTGSDSRKHQLLFSSGQSASRKPCWTVCTAPELSDGRSGCRFCYKHLKQSPCMRGSCFY